MAMQVKIRLRSGTSEEWATKNPVLTLAEPGYDSTTRTLKVGDGSSAWNDLPVTVTTDQIEAAIANSAAVHNGIHAISHGVNGSDRLTPESIGASAGGAAVFKTAYDGGWITAKALADGTDLNAVVGSGVYVLTSGGGNTEEKGYPFTGFTGTIELIRWYSDNFATQRAISSNGSTPITYTRTKSGGTWRPWAKMASSEDTGWRDVTALATPGTVASGKILLRRQNSTVTVQFESLTPTANASAAVHLFSNATPLPLGFRGFSAVHMNGLFSQANAVATMFHVSLWSNTSLSVFQRYGFSTWWQTTNPLGGQMTFTTDDPWPTILPGVAA